jgi:hypothetical protein
VLCGLEKQMKPIVESVDGTFVVSVFSGLKLVWFRPEAGLGFIIV